MTPLLDMAPLQRDRLDSPQSGLVQLARQPTPGLRWVSQSVALGPAWLRSAFGLNVRARRTYIVAGSLVVVALALVLPAVQVCRDWAFVDRNTASRKGYRDWSFGWRTGSWYRESALEMFMRSNHPAELRQDWISYAGTGRSLFGGATLHGHGRPGPIILLRPEAMEAYCQAASHIEKRRIYDVFASGDEAKIRELADQISEANMTSGKTEPARCRQGRAAVWGASLHIRLE